MGDHRNNSSDSRDWGQVLTSSARFAASDGTWTRTLKLVGANDCTGDTAIVNRSPAFTVIAADRKTPHANGWMFIASF